MELFSESAIRINRITSYAHFIADRLVAYAAQSAAELVE